MKRLISFLSVAAIFIMSTATLTSCGNAAEKARSEIARQVRDFNKDLPAYMRAGYNLDSISYNEQKNNVVYSYSVDTTYMPRAVFHERLAEGKKKIIGSMAQPDPDLQKFINNIISADASVTYSYTFSDGVSERIPVSASEIKEMLESINQPQ